MANEIKAKYGTSTAFDIDLASLASSTSKVGNYSAVVDFGTTVKGQLVHLYFKVTTGTSPTASRGIYPVLVKGDVGSAVSNISSDGCYDSSTAKGSAKTFNGADALPGVSTDSTSNKAYEWACSVLSPGPGWGVGIHHDTGVNLHSTAGNHSVRYVVENPEVQ